MSSSPGKVIQTQRTVVKCLNKLLSIPSTESLASQVLGTKTVTRLNHFFNLTGDALESIPRLLPIFGKIAHTPGHVLHHLARIKPGIVELANHPGSLFKREPKSFGSG